MTTPARIDGREKTIAVKVSATEFEMIARRAQQEALQPGVFARRLLVLASRESA